MLNIKATMLTLSVTVLCNLFVVSAQAVELPPYQDKAYRCWLNEQGVVSLKCVNDPFVRASQSLSPNFVNNASMDSEDAVFLLQDMLSAGQFKQATQMFQQNPQAFGEKVWEIALYNKPFNMHDVEVLAKDAICRNHPSCLISVSDMAGF